jgi:hypothetical protein
MKIWNQNNSRPSSLLKTVSVVAVAVTCAFGFAMTAQAQSCTISNWEGGATNLSNNDSGLPTDGFRRYAGPCSLEVPIDGTPRFLTDNSPSGDENQYIVRFYFFVDGVGTDPIQIYAADDGGDDVITLVYENGDLTLSVDDGGTMVGTTVGNIGAGWHSAEFVWEQAADATILFSVDGDDDIEINNVDSSGYSISNAHLGNLAASNGGGSIYFDDYDSRRQTRPGRLLRGDANDDGNHSAADNIAINIERLNQGLAPGQPDCNEDGNISAADNICVNLIRLNQMDP